MRYGAYIAAAIFPINAAPRVLSIVGTPIWKSRCRYVLSTKESKGKQRAQQSCRDRMSGTLVLATVESRSAPRQIYV